MIDRNAQPAELSRPSRNETTGVTTAVQAGSLQSAVPSRPRRQIEISADNQSMIRRSYEVGYVVDLFISDRKGGWRHRPLQMQREQVNSFAVDDCSREKGGNVGVREVPNDGIRERGTTQQSNSERPVARLRCKMRIRFRQCAEVLMPFERIFLENHNVALYGRQESRRGGLISSSGSQVVADYRQFE